MEAVHMELLPKRITSNIVAPSQHCSLGAKSVKCVQALMTNDDQNCSSRLLTLEFQKLKLTWYQSVAHKTKV